MSKSGSRVAGGVCVSLIFLGCGATDSHGVLAVDSGASSASSLDSGPGSGSGSVASTGSASGSGAASGSLAASGSAVEAGSGTGSNSGSVADAGAHDAGSLDGAVVVDAGKAFSQCRFHFGTLDGTAKSAGSALISQLDMFTSGWIGSSTGLPAAVCNETKPGGALVGKVPALVAYVIAFTARSAPGWCLADCNATNANCSPASDLCTKGADYIRQNITTRILPEYRSNAQSFAQACGTTRPMIWQMEPDYYQYFAAAQGGGTRGQPGGPLSGAEAANYMSQIIATVRQYLPNVLFSMDTSPWMPNNGCAGANATANPGWYSYFNMTDFTFVNTSGGGTLASSANIRSGQATWAGIHQCSGNKPILADTGYGVAGSSSGPDPAWDLPANINARMAEGVISVTQYNPSASSWGATLSAARPSLANPVQCY